MSNSQIRVVYNQVCQEGNWSACEVVPGILPFETKKQDVQSLTSKRKEDVPPQAGEEKEPEPEKEKKPEKEPEPEKEKKPEPEKEKVSSLPIQSRSRFRFNSLSGW